jgi:RimJ/RimL family protein N-acetyltransferase
MSIESVVLGPLCPEDSVDLWQWINARELVIESSAYRPVHGAAHAEWFVRMQQQKDCVLFGIRLVPSNLLIGSCQLHSIHSVHHSAELQIRIGRPNCRGKGYGSQALRQLLDFGFRDLNLNRIYLHVLANNVAAQRLYVRWHFQHEGCLRSAVYIDGRYLDVILMGLLREDYLNGPDARVSATAGRDR